MRLGARVCVAGVVFILASGAPPEVSAQTGPGESTFPFEPWNMHLAALSGAGAAAEGLPFLAVNPAAVAGGRSAIVSYRRSPAGLRDYGIDAAQSFDWGTVAIAVRRRDWGELAGDLGLSELTAGEQSVAAAYANDVFHDRLRLGLAVSRLDQEFLGNSTRGWALDVGAQAHLGWGLQVGVSTLHVGEGLEGQRGTTPFPSRVRFGTSWTGRIERIHAMAGSDVAVPVRSGSDIDVHVGVRCEYKASPLSASASAGWQSLGDRYGTGSSETSFSFGGAVAVGPIEVGMATAPRGAIGRDLVVSLGAYW